MPSALAATTATAASTGARAGATRVPFAINDELSASVDVGTGNLMVTTRDVTTPAGPGMTSFGLAYQSLAAGTQAAVGSFFAGGYSDVGVLHDVGVGERDECY